MCAFQLERYLYLYMIEIESLFTPLMGNWYLSRRLLHAHRSPITNTNVTVGAVRHPYRRHKKKLILDAQDFTSFILYSQTRRYKHSHIFSYK